MSDIEADDDTVHYSGSSGGFGSVLGMAKVFARELSSPGTLDTLRRQNKPEGYMCSSCAWAKPPEPHAFEFCENGANPKPRWDAWTDDYALVRDEIAETYPEEFHDFNDRMWKAGGFYRGNAAHERVWKTDSGKAEFTVPTVLSAVGVPGGNGRFHLITVRSNDQFNTTIYGMDDRLRGINGSRTVLLINRDDMRRQGLSEGEIVALVGDAGDDVRREVGGLTVTPFDLPDGCLGGYYPEMNPLIPLWYHDKASKTPASKGVPVRIERTANAA